jgi:diaminohydroxyphosphoribosylaminopyrimidine deaminase / 5-amino-6-(5-phosphoribosylamino)uracil reductase
MQVEQAMSEALELAARGNGNTSPNPMVGAVVLASNGDIAGTGYHERAGAPHAETRALAGAGERARGGTLVVTLEPCHRHGRTPPCTDGIAAAGVARVVVAMLDPDPHERGAGVEALRASGIRVDVGVGEPAAARLNRMYVRHRTTGRPWITLKMAQSIDGAIGAERGRRERITGPEAGRHVDDLRFSHDAVMVGVETAIVDDPQLTVRPLRERAVPYTRIVVDSAARLPVGSTLVARQQDAATIVAITERAPAARVAALEAAGAGIIRCASDAAGRVDVHDLLERLGARGMLGVLCEGGPTLAASLLSAGSVDELHWLLAPCILGTARANPVLARIPRHVDFIISEHRVLGEDVLVIAAPAAVAASD